MSVIASTLSRYRIASGLADRFGRKLHVAGQNAFSYDMARNGEQWLVSKLAPHLDCVIDVGANQGKWTAAVMAQAPSADIYAIEAIPEFAATVRERVGGKAHIIEAALSDSPGSLTIYKSGLGGRAALLNTKKAWQAINLEARTGDSVVQELRVDALSLVKIDTDGFDMPIIRGFAKSITKYRPIVQFEYSRFWISTRHYLSDAYSFFDERDYVVGRLMPNRVRFKKYTTHDETFFTNNFVAAPKEKRYLLE